MRELLGDALPYQRELAHLTGSVNAAWLLTRVVFEHRRHLHARGWFRMRLQEVERDLGLSRWELETARARLREPRFIEERRDFSPPQLYVRAVPDAIRVALCLREVARSASCQAMRMARTGAPSIVGNSDLRDAQKRHPNYRKSRKLGRRKTTSQDGGNVHLRMAENHISYNNKEANLTIEDLTTTTTTGTATGGETRQHADDRVVVVDEARSEKAITVRICGTQEGQAGAARGCPAAGHAGGATHCPAAGHFDAAPATPRNTEGEFPKAASPCPVAGHSTLKQRCLTAGQAVAETDCPAARQSDAGLPPQRKPEGQTNVVPPCPVAGHSEPAPHHPNVGHDDGAAERCPATGHLDLIFPRDFLAAECQLARQALAAISPQRRQLILDEIEGRQRKGRRIDSRLSLLRALVEAERAGHFTPAYSWEIKDARARAAQRETERRDRDEQPRVAWQAARNAITARTGGKTGFEAFKAFAARLRKARGRPTQAPTDKEDSK